VDTAVHLYIDPVAARLPSVVAPNPPALSTICYRLTRVPAHLKRSTVTRVYLFQCLLLLLQTLYFFFQLTSLIIILFSILLATAVSFSLLSYIARVVGSIHFLPSLFPSIPSYFLQHYSALFFDLEGL